MDRTYDVIVIGAGMGGLMCGNFLAKGGKRVLILEHNHQPGGLMSGFWRKGFYFDGGDQSMENMGITFPLLRQLGLYNPQDWERCTFRLITPEFDHIIKNFENAAKVFYQAFPQDQQGIKKYFSKLQAYSDFLNEADEKGRLPYTAKGFEALKGIVRLVQVISRQKKTAAELFTGKHDDLVDKYIRDPKAARFFKGIGYPGQSTFMCVGAWYCWIYDYHYPRKGIKSLMDRLADHFCTLSGEIKFNSRVDEVMVEKGRARGVRTSRGEVYRADKIVHCGDMARLYTKMLPPGTAAPGFVDKIANAPITEPIIGLYLGLSISPQELGKILKTHHTFFFPDGGIKDLSDINDPEQHKGTWLEINAPGIKNPWLAPEGKSSITVQTMSSHKWLNYWGTGGDDFSRPEQYRELKLKVAHQMLDTLSMVIPGVKEKVEYWDLGSPMSTIRFTLNKEGGSCGFTVDPDKAPFSKQPLQLRTPVRGLYQAGQWALWPGGVIGSALSGKMVASHIRWGYYSDLTDRIYQRFFRTK